MTARRFVFPPLAFALCALVALGTGQAQDKKDEKKKDEKKVEKKAEKKLPEPSIPPMYSRRSSHSRSAAVDPITPRVCS